MTPTPTATPSAAIGGQRTGIRSPGIVSDPAIDEHFKRSLGLEEYAAVFNASSTIDKETSLSGQFSTKKKKHSIDDAFALTIPTKNLIQSKF